jgi:polyisoprenoid-binding protein YceI
MMISKVRGRFRRFSGTVDIGEVPEDSSVAVVIEAGTVDTGDEARDRHLRGPDFLDVARHPHIVYVSRAIRALPDDDRRYEVVGDLTIRDVTRTVPLTVEFAGVALDPWGNVRAGFLAKAEIDREDFDVRWNQVLETGGFLVGRRVEVEIEAELVLEQDQP